MSKRERERETERDRERDRETLTFLGFQRTIDPSIDLGSHWLNDLWFQGEGGCVQQVYVLCRYPLT